MLILKTLLKKGTKMEELKNKTVQALEDELAKDEFNAEKVDVLQRLLNVIVR